MARGSLADGTRGFTSTEGAFLAAPASLVMARRSLAARPLDPGRRAGTLEVEPDGLRAPRPRLFSLAQGFPFATERFPVSAQSHRHLAGCPAASRQRHFSPDLGSMGRSRGLGIAARTFGPRKRSLRPDAQAFLPTRKPSSRRASLARATKHAAAAQWRSRRHHRRPADAQRKRATGLAAHESAAPPGALRGLGGAARSAAAACGGTSGGIGESRDGGHNVVAGAEGEAGQDKTTRRRCAEMGCES
jgi:hypothetical protein